MQAAQCGAIGHQVFPNRTSRMARSGFFCQTGNKSLLKEAAQNEVEQ